MLKILYIYDEKTPFESVKTMQHLLFEALREDTRVTRVISGKKNDYATLLREHDVVIGLDYELLGVRKSENLGIPILLLSYGLGTRALLPIWEMRELLQQNDAFICSSSTDLASVAMRLQDEQIQLHYIPFCSPSFGNIFKDNETKGIAAVLNLPQDNSKWMLYAGRLNQQKNVHLVLEILGELVKRKHDVRLIIAGSEDKANFPELFWDNAGYEEFLKLRTAEMNLAERVHFLGHVDSTLMPLLYEFVDVHVTCSTFRTEDFGLTPIEAMAVGTPTVGTAWGGFWDTIEDQYTGFHMPVYLSESGFRVDWMSGALFIDKILRDANLRRSLSITCKVIAANKYSFAVFKARVLDTVSKAARNQNPAFMPIDFQKIPDQPTMALLADLERNLQEKGNLLLAREGLFLDPLMERVKLFLGAYARYREAKLSFSDKLYIPLKIDIQGNSVKLLDRNWTSEIELSPMEVQVLHTANSQKFLTDIATELDVPIENVFRICQKLVAKGLIIPIQAPLD